MVAQLKDSVVSATKSPGRSDYKSLLGQWAQRHHACNPLYSVVDVEGPDHELVFTVQVAINGIAIGKAIGSSKKNAEQLAAKIALESEGLL